MTGSGSGPARAFPLAVFLDRDGTIIRDSGYLSDPSGVQLLPGAGQAIARLNRQGVCVVIVTNQSGISRGLYDEAAFRAVQAEVERLLSESGARVDAVYHCPHTPDDACECRKPGLRLYRQAEADLGLDLARAFYIGDRDSDVRPALATGGQGVLVAGRDGRYDDAAPAECLRVPDLLSGVEKILADSVLNLGNHTEEGR